MLAQNSPQFASGTTTTGYLSDRIALLARKRQLAEELAQLEVRLNEPIITTIKGGTAPPDLFGDVVAFHDKFGVQNPTKNEDHQLDFTMQKFKLDHLQEELNEYRLAVNEGDMEKAFDALIDLVYVALGAAHAHGFAFNDGWRRVHAANMMKKRAESAQESKRGRKFDIVKPEGWLPPILGDLL